MDGIFNRTSDFNLMPYDDEAFEAIRRVPEGTSIHVTWDEARSVKFHRKIFALLKFSFENTERVTGEYKDQMIEQSFDRYRKDAIILAGFYELDVNTKGVVRAVADSIAFNKCTQEKAERIYSGLLDYVAREIFNNNYRLDELEELSEKWKGFV